MGSFETHLKNKKRLVIILTKITIFVNRIKKIEYNKIMKKNIVKFWFIACIVGFLFSACNDTTRLSESEMQYVGIWKAADGTYIRIDADGSGSFDIQGKSITGGKVKIEDKTITISLLGIKERFVIDSGPIKENGELVIVLDGIRYKNMNK